MPLEDTGALFSCHVLSCCASAPLHYAILGACSAHRLDAGLQLAGPLAPPSHTVEMSPGQPQVPPEDGPCSVARWDCCLVQGYDTVSQQLCAVGLPACEQY